MRYKCGNSMRGKKVIHSKEHLQNISKALKGKKWIHKGTEKKYIKPNELDKYLELGWKLGKKDRIIKERKSMSEIKKGGHWICNKK